MTAKQAPEPGTPLPWAIGPASIIASRRPIELPDGAGRITEWVAECIGRERAEQDARYIVHACNCFPGLLEALEALHLFHASGGHESDPDHALLLADAAIAKARAAQ
jgi:hypothetical protein